MSPNSTTHNETVNITTGSAPSTEGDTVTYHNPKRERLEQWHGAIEQELQQCLVEATELRKKISEAKTQAKRTYYDKKFKKVAERSMQMVAALQNVRQMEGKDE